jgi:hypothetical protein
MLLHVERYLKNYLYNVFDRYFINDRNFFSLKILFFIFSLLDWKV